MIRLLVRPLILIIFSLTLFSCSSQQHSVVAADNRQEEQEVLAALTVFVEAFENGELETMEESFADDATSFPRAIMSANNSTAINNEDYRRVRGLDPQMRQLIALWYASDAEPPYMMLEPRDLEIKMFGDAALVSFHLLDGNALSRRSFVLSKQTGEWKIVHLHASNVVSSD